MAFKAILDSVDDLPEEVKKEYVERNGKWEIQVEGMKTQADVDRVQGALTKERTEHGALKSRFALLGDRKIEDILPELDKIDEYKAAADGKLDDEKINGIVEARVKTRVAPIERERDTLKGQVAEKDQLITGFQAQEKTRTIHDQARRAATSAKLLPEAVDDFLLLADRVFEVRADDGKVVVKDNVGFTPGVEPSVLLTDLADKRPHWWGTTSGGGGRGSTTGGSGTVNPFSHEHWNLTEQGKIVTTDPSKADQLAKAAGTTVGGGRPAAKK